MSKRFLVITIVTISIVLIIGYIFYENKSRYRTLEMERNEIDKVKALEDIKSASKSVGVVGNYFADNITDYTVLQIYVCGNYYCDVFLGNIINRSGIEIPEETFFVLTGNVRGSVTESYLDFEVTGVKKFILPKDGKKACQQFIKKNPDKILGTTFTDKMVSAALSKFPDAKIDTIDFTGTKLEYEVLLVDYDHYLECLYNSVTNSVDFVRITEITGLDP